MRRFAPLLLVLLTGCGSASPADLPAPAGPPPSPPLTTAPAGTVAGSPFGVSGVETATREPASRRTCPDAIAFAQLGRGAQLAVLCGRERMLELYDAKTLERLGRVGAGIGPTGLAGDGVDLLFVVDSLGESLLVYHREPFEPLRRVHLGGGPYAIAFDRERRGLWISLNKANQVVHYAAGTRPVIRETLPSIRDARSIVVAGNELSVIGAEDVQVVRLRSR